MTNEPTKKEAIELAEDFTDWMGASWPMCGGINATVKLADMASKRIKTAERLAKIEAADRFCAQCPGKEDGMCGECPDRAVILGETVNEGKTEAEKPGYCGEGVGVRKYKYSKN